MSDCIRYRIGDRVLELNPDETQPVRDIDDPPGAYQNQPSADILPGFGEKREDCGDEIPHFCSDCGHVVAEVGQTCYQWECPRCAPAAAMRRTTTACAKIEETRKSRSRGTDDWKFHHVTIRPPNDEVLAFAREDAKQAFFDVSKALLSNLGAIGGVLIYHPWTGEDEDDRGKWSDRLFSGRLWSEDVKSELEHQPHMHAIVVARSIDHHHCSALHEQSGMIIHRIEKQDSNVSLFGLEDLSRAVSYSMSHLGVEDGSADYRYFGAVSQTSAGDQTEARVRRIVRSVVPETLGVSLPDLSCHRELEEDEPQPVPAGGVGDSDSTDTEEDEPQPVPAGGVGDSDSTDTDPDESDHTRRCGGRLRPITDAPYFLQNHDLRHEERLREAWEQWPPPGDD